MRIIDTQKKIHLSTQKFLDYSYMIFREGRFLHEEVKLAKELLNGEALYDSRVKGKMVPNSAHTVNVGFEQLQGLAQVMSYFCDRYGPLKGFILGELFFRKGSSEQDLLDYANVLDDFGDRNAVLRSKFYKWFILNYLQKDIRND